MEFMTKILIGLMIIIMGIFNTKGNISMLHSYHKKRVKTEDIIPFGKLMGIGTIIIGSTIIIVSVIEFFINKSIIINFMLIVGLIVGIIIILYALFKYNKGIF